MVKITPEVSVEISANAPRFFSTLKKAQADLKGFENQLKNSFGGGGGLINQLIGGFTLYNVGSQIIEVTGEFQRFEAILTNTLGSNSAANKALDNIKEFARTTPFQVGEITAAYVRWANMGLDPTIDRMKKIGDIAASTGAGFEQTAEAFKDLMVGQTKRIEEVGISAQQANGKIQLSFKGLNLEIEKNAEGVQKALDVYSQMNGVLGTQDELSKQLKGQISNLKDSWDLLLGEIGAGNTGVLFNTVKFLRDILELTRKINSLGDKGVGFLKSKQEEQQKIGLTGSAPTIQEAFNAGILDKLIKAQFVSASQGNKSFFEKALGTEFGQRQAIGAIIDPVKSKGINYIVSQTGKAYKEFAQILKDNNYTVEETNIVWNRFIEISREAYTAEQKRIAAEKDALTLEEQKRKAKELSDFLAQKELERKEYLLRLNKYEQEDLKLSIEQNKRFNETLRERLALSNAGISAEMVGMRNPETGKLAKPPGMEGYVNKAKAALKGTGELSDEVENQIKLVKALDDSFANAAKGGLLDFAFGLQDVFKNEISFGDNILRALAGFLQEFGRQLIILGTGQMALSETIKQMFSGNAAAGAAAVAAGVAMMAIGGAVQSGVQSRMQKLAQTGSASNVNNINRSNEIKISGQLIGSGSDLIAVINNASFDNKIRKGG